MKNQEWKVARVASCLLIGFFIMGILHPPHVLSQTGTPALPQPGKRFAQKTDVWGVAYTVTIKGNGVDEGEPGSGEPGASWSISRIYHGNIMLLDGLVMSDPKWTLKEYDDFMLSERKLLFFDKSPLLHVVIKDWVNRVGDVSCAQYSTSLETWNADFRDKSMEIATLKIDNKDLTHDTWFPTKDITKGTVTHQTSVTNYPVGTVERGKPENLSISTYWVPDIKEWLTGGAVIRNNVNFVKNENGSYIFESPEMPVKESLLRGIDTSGKVTVKIMYGLIRREK